MLRLTFLLLIFSAKIGFGQDGRSDKQYSITYDTLQHNVRPVKNYKQLVKAGVSLPLLRQSSVSSATYWKSIGLDVTSEYRIRGGLAMIGGLETVYSFTKYAQLYNLEMPIGLRYYFSLGERMKNRVDPHSFFSHYVGFQTYNTLFSSMFYDTPNPNAERYYRGSFLDRRTNIGKYDEAFNFIQYAYFQIGTQLKLGPSRYLDINAILPVHQVIYNKSNLTLSTPSFVTIRYGFVWPR